MTQLPQPIWNQIAFEYQLETQWAKDRFRMNEDEISETLDTEAKKLSLQGYSNKAILAYQTILPFYLEKKAIHDFFMKDNDPEIIKMIPLPNSLHEARLIVEAEYWLTENDQDQFIDLLSSH
ncbi:hypothetical protein AB2B38_005965 [Balneola sp. MJW-20]|uniref:hypothetical protein n=1 Tax=Gracilimonas aurantiaca TaxID=3234185 RepID=UPI0034657CDF